jgi:hypothetical protein
MLHIDTLGKPSDACSFVLHRQFATADHWRIFHISIVPELADQLIFVLTIVSVVLFVLSSAPNRY